MHAPRLLCVAYDTTPSNVLRKLVAHAAQNGMSTDYVILDGGALPPPSPSALESKIQNADMVVIGMSSEKNAGIEIETARLCVAHGTRFGFFADTHGAYKREWFSEFRLTATFVLVVSEDEELAARITFPVAKITTTGNPQWAAYFEPKDREAARTLVRAGSGDYLVFAPGTKDPDHNIRVWSATIRAASLHWDNRIVALSRHPGDKTDHSRYEQLGRHAGDSCRVCWYEGPGDALLPGADLLINGTSLRVHALARLVPVIDYYEKASQDWLERDIGSRFGYFYSSGAVLDVYDETWVDLAAAMQVVDHHPTILRSKQSTAIKRMSERESLDVMCAAIVPPAYA